MKAYRLDCSEDAYFADPLQDPSLSQSTGHRIVSQSPYHGWLYHPRLGGRPSKPTEAMKEGTIVDQFLLGEPIVDGDGPLIKWRAGRLAAIDCVAFRSNEAKEAKRLAEDRGLLPVKVAEFEAAYERSHKIAGALFEAGYPLSGECQVQVAWQAPSVHGPVWCRGMLDHLNLMTRVWDLKFVESAKPRAIDASIYKYGYDIQGAAYTQAIETLYPEYAGRVTFTLLCIEKSTLVVTPVEFAGSMKRLGELRWESAVNTWASCMKAGTEEQHWPKYLSAGEVHRAEAQPWMLAEWGIDE